MIWKEGDDWKVSVLSKAVGRIPTASFVCVTSLNLSFCLSLHSSPEMPNFFFSETLMAPLCSINSLVTSMSTTAPETKMAVLCKTCAGALSYRANGVVSDVDALLEYRAFPGFFSGKIMYILCTNIGT